MRIVMDEAGDLPAELIVKYNIKTLPINIMFGNEQYRSGLDIDQATFYEKIEGVNSDNFPKTSQPSPYQFAECFKEILAEGEQEILAVVVSQKMSGTYDSAVQAARELEGKGRIHVFDSMAGSAAQGFMAIEASRMQAAGEKYEAIRARLETMRDEMIIVLMIDSLEYAVKGGRVSSIRSLMASLLNVKPILRVIDGAFVEAGRVRTHKKALAHILEQVRNHIGERPTRLAVMHARAPDVGRRLLEMAKALINTTDALLMELSIPVTVNLGPGALGIIAIPE